ncbi:MAG: anthranilate phosphoribosyltransferase [Gemmatimonadetes bacterium]|nr:anthranilate phosphoribosyltransferase [Gemmatimonadota bacterium]
MELTRLIAKVTDGHDLTVAEAAAAFGQVMSGQASPVQIAALLAGLRTKGHAPAEVAGGVQALRGAMIRVQAPTDRVLVDTCGTGGGSVGTFNISTAAAFVVAGAGVGVAKHGNRSFTSRSGSADVLEALGVNIQLTPEAMGRVLAKTGIVFMFAPLLHPAMRHVGPVRKELGIPTIMNLLGPLTNPAGVRRQVVGVADPDAVPIIARALQELGHERAMVVHGSPGMDELSPLGVTRVAELRDGEVHEFEVGLGELGLPTASAEEIAGGTPEENAGRILSVLEGRDVGGALTVTLLNAAAGLYVAGASRSLGEGVARAREVISSGAALRALNALKEASSAERSS